MRGGFGAHLFNFLFHLFRRFAPGEIQIDLFCRQILCNVRRSAKVKRRTRLLNRWEIEFCITYVNVFAFIGDGFALKQTTPDAGEFCRGLIAFGVVEEDAVSREFRWVAAGDQIKQRTSVGESVERGGLAGSNGG
ncbi:hypothetical protein D3C78_936720 [compost metagenome]